jgi:hypothetical protein
MRRPAKNSMRFSAVEAATQARRRQLFSTRALRPQLGSE